jgi:hypothetical protein
VSLASAVGAVYLNVSTLCLSNTATVLVYISTPFLYSTYRARGMKSVVSVSTPLHSLSQQIRPPILPIGVSATGRLSPPFGFVDSPWDHTIRSAAVGCNFLCFESMAPSGEKSRFVQYSVEPIIERSTTPTDRCYRSASYTTQRVL